MWHSGRLCNTNSARVCMNKEGTEKRQIFQKEKNRFLEIISTVYDNYEQSKKSNDSLKKKKRWIPPTTRPFKVIVSVNNRKIMKVFDLFIVILALF